MVFEFTSEGPKGNILKIVKFSETSLKDFYNLAFGDKDIVSGELNDTIISNNGDSEKVLAQVVTAVYSFTNRYPDAWVYAIGSTKSRTRLYKMGITKYFDEVEEDFEVYGLTENEWEFFKKDAEYDAFLVKRKV